MIEFTLQNISLIIVLGFTIFGWLIAFGIKINYGRLSNSLTKIQINPKFAWFLFEVPNLLWALYFILYNQDSVTLGYFLFIIHYINRDILYPLSLKTQTKVPLQITFSAFSFTFANGYLQGLSNSRTVDSNIVLKIVGIFLFILGMWINIKSDSILQKTKEKSMQISRQKKEIDDKGKGKQSKYVRIDEFLFKYVANPNYFGEVIQWFGYFFVCQTFYSFLFAFSTINILTAGAIPRSKWNKQNIPNYPKQRKAIIPFII